LTLLLLFSFFSFIAFERLRFLSNALKRDRKEKRDGQQRRYSASEVSHHQKESNRQGLPKN
jgi:hypothetical protein